MSAQPPQPVSLLWEMVVATILGVAAGVIADNIVVGSGVGIVLGVVLSVIKTQRGGWGRRP